MLEPGRGNDFIHFLRLHSCDIHFDATVESTKSLAVSFHSPFQSFDLKICEIHESILVYFEGKLFWFL